MSTHASLIIQTGKKKFSVCYVHFDGYPSHLGCLLTWYDKQKLVNQLAQHHFSSVEKNFKDCDLSSDTEDPPVYSSLEEVKRRGSLEEWCYLWLMKPAKWYLYDRGVAIPLEGIVEGEDLEELAKLTK